MTIEDKKATHFAPALDSSIETLPSAPTDLSATGSESQAGAGKRSNEIDEKREPEQKPVKQQPSKGYPSTVAAAHAKQLAISKRSILSNSSAFSTLPNRRANTLLDQPLQGNMDLLPWKKTKDEFIKLAAAAIPLHWMAKCRGWELKSFTLVLSESLSSRLDDGDASALEYLRDEMARRVPAALGSGAEFLYGIEKAPVVFADKSSRRRWHLHGLMIGPAGFASPGKNTPLRRALRPIKGEADADLMFQSPGEKLDLDKRSSAIRWCFYAVKNGLTLQLNPALAGAYESPPGKQTYISTQLRREAHRWHDGALVGMTAPELIQADRRGIYEPVVDADV